MSKMFQKFELNEKIKQKRREGIKRSRRMEKVYRTKVQGQTECQRIGSEKFDLSNVDRIKFRMY